MLDPTPLFRRFAIARERAPTRPEAAQLGVLARLLAAAAGTRFGRAHGFDAIRSLDDYRRAVPLRDWHDFWRQWWEPAFPVLDGVSWPGRIPFFAETSGTTSGVTRHVPVSRAMLASNRRAALAVACAELRRNPRSRFFGGPSLILGGSTALARLAPGIRSGDLSGIAAATMPAWTTGRALPSREVALLADWNAKLDRVAAEIRGRDLRTISGTPSWLLILFERLLEGTGATNLRALFPSLELVIHGGVGFSPYRRRFSEVLGDGVGTREVYPASEGFIAYEDERRDDGALRPLLDNGIFLEFVPADALGDADPPRFWVGDVEPGRDHALVLTTDAGLFSYLLGDAVRVVSRDPFRLVVAGRTGQTLSAFGEHVSGGELDRAIEAAARAARTTVTDYAATIVPPDGEDPRGGHRFLVEPAPGTAPDAACFAGVLDRTLASHNADYASHREGGHGMRPPEIAFVPPGFFAGWMAQRGRLGGQNKVPRVITDPALLASLRQRLEQTQGRPA